MKIDNVTAYKHSDGTYTLGIVLNDADAALDTWLYKKDCSAINNVQMCLKNVTPDEMLAVAKAIIEAANQTGETTAEWPLLPFTTTGRALPILRTHGRSWRIHPERTVIQTLAGVQYSGDAFKSSYKAVETIPRDKWTVGMLRTEEYAKFLHKLLLGHNVNVQYFSDMGIQESADYSLGQITFNKVHCGEALFDTANPDLTGLLIHEFSHNVTDSNSEHGARWYAEFQRLSGLAVHYASSNKEFQEYLKGGN